MKEFIFLVITGVIALAWGSLLFRRADGFSTVAGASASGFSTITKTLFSA